MNNQVGSTWYATQQNLAAGFQTIFKFRMSHPGLDHADGLTFAIQTVGTAALGGIGCDMGYGGITRSLVVEFDTWANPPGGCNDANDPNNNHIAIHTQGFNANSRIHRTTPNPPDWGVLENGTDIGDGNVHEARIIYAPTSVLGSSYTGVMRIFVDDFPVYSQPVNLAPILSTGGLAWVGFTAATAAAYENHDIISWDFVTALQVTNNSDNISVPSVGSLRKLVTDTPSGGIITFASGVTNISLDGVIIINKNLTIDAGGIQQTPTDTGLKFSLTITCSNPCLVQDKRAFRVPQGWSVYIGGMIFEHFSPYAGGSVITNQGKLTLTNVLMQLNTAKWNGVVPSQDQGRGGAIYNSFSNGNGALVVDSSTIRGNTADCDGGAIYNGGKLIIKNSTFNGNKANQSSLTCESYTRGGGVIVDFAPGTSVKIYNSLFDTNLAKQGGAIYTNGTTGSVPALDNSTFTNNVSTSLGGAAFYADTGGNQPVLQNVTIAYNNVKQSTTQGSLYANSIKLYNTIVAKSGLADSNGTYVPGSVSNNCAGNLSNIDQQHNLSNDNTCNFSILHGSLVTDPNVAATLAANGGLTKTLALQNGSPAIDQGYQAVCLYLYDQRGPGYLRKNGTSCDIGAFEY